MHALRRFAITLLDTLLPPTALERAARALTPAQLARFLAVTHHGDIVTLFHYREPLIRHLIWSLKYRGNTHAAMLLSAVLYDTLLEEISDEYLFHGSRAVIIVPVPLSEARLRKRGFNQAALLGKALTARTSSSETIPLVEDMLIKVRDTAPQTTLSREERLTNLHNAFRVRRSSEIHNRHVILLDDVMTTGSTLREAKRMLERAGARRVLPIALAH